MGEFPFMVICLDSKYLNKKDHTKWSGKGTPFFSIISSLIYTAFSHGFFFRTVTTHKIVSLNCVKYLNTVQRTSPEVTVEVSLVSLLVLGLFFHSEV